MGKFVGTDSPETLHGTRTTDEADDIYGYGGADTLYGYGGNDRLFGGLGADTMYGGTGTGDWAIYIHDPTVGVFVSLETGLGHNGSAEGDRLYGIENLHGTYRGDWLFGNGVPNHIRGAWGNDLLKGGGGSDHLQGDDDNDTLNGGSGGDTLDGGAAIDTASYEGSPAGVFVSILPSWLIADWGDAAGDVLIGIENLTGSAHGDLTTRQTCSGAWTAATRSRAAAATTAWRAATATTRSAAAPAKTS